MQIEIVDEPPAARPFGFAQLSEVIIDELALAAAIRRGLERQRIHVTTSLGLDVESRRDARGQVVELRTLHGTLLHFERDSFGDPLRQWLATKAVITNTYDAMNRVTARNLGRAGEAVAREPEPQWIGTLPPGMLRKLYHYDVHDELIQAVHSERGATDYEYNARRNLLATRSEAWNERSQVDPTENVNEVVNGALQRSYARGNRLVAKGDARYAYDEAGNVIEKRLTPANDGTTLVWRYEYDGWGLLAAVDLPDARRVEFKYDAFARRVSKQVFAVDARGTRQTESHVHYVWDRLTLVHEVDVESASPLRSYAYEENDSPTPLAHCEGSLQGTPPAWLYYLSDHHDAPEELVDGEGHVVNRLLRDARGKLIREDRGAPTTPFRNPGQYSDEETGLHYNRYRYYDPDTGRYLSPDPISLAGGLNAYAATPNTVSWFDLMGWVHTMIVLEAQNVPGVQKGDVFLSGMKDLPDGHPLKNRAKCHSERKLDKKVRDSKKGKSGAKKLRLGGQLPPCPNCHRALQQLAEEKGVDIEYVYPVDATDPSNPKIHPNAQSVKYDGSGGAPPQFTDSKLASAYELDKLDEPTEGGYTHGYKKGYDTAQAGYSAAKGRTPKF